MRAMYLYIIIVASLSLVTIATTAEQLKSKRLLINDPNHIESELNTLKAEVNDLKTKLVDITGKYNNLLSTRHSTVTGVVYIVWGRKNCPGNANNTLIYTGLAAGGAYDNPGSAVEPVCLPHDPIFGSKQASNYPDVMYGSEYVSDNFFGPNSADQDVPCAVCNSEGASQYLMIPGRNQCYNGWTEQYHGYLTSNHYINKRGSTFTCMHETPEFLEGGTANQDGHVFYGVVTSCGSLKCPPYIDHKPLTCVVCTR